MLPRTGPFWKHCVWRNPTPHSATFILLHTSDRPNSASGSDVRFFLAICTQEIAADHDQTNRQDLVFKTWCSSGRQESLTALFNSEKIISGSARCSFFSQSIRRPTLGWKRTIFPMFLSWRSKKVTGDQVIFYIFCIFAIFYISCILCIWHVLIVALPGWMRVSPPSWYTSAVNQNKSCISFQCMQNMSIWHNIAICHEYDKK